MIRKFGYNYFFLLNFQKNANPLSKPLYNNLIIIEQWIYKRNKLKFSICLRKFDSIDTIVKVAY